MEECDAFDIGFHLFAIALSILLLWYLYLVWTWPDAGKGIVTQITTTVLFGVPAVLILVVALRNLLKYIGCKMQKR